MINFLTGDSRFFWPENIKYLSHFPFAWDSSLNTGIGIPDINTLWITSYLNVTSLFSYLGLSWFLISLIFWIIPILSISFLSSFFLCREVINKNIPLSIISGIIYATNTYFLMIFLGGQLGVSFAYAFIPLVILAFFMLVNKTNIRLSTIFGLIFSLQVLFDPRIAFLTVLALGLFYLMRFKFIFKELIFLLVVPSAIVFSLHSFWILPLVFFKGNLISAEYEFIIGAKFFSFAFLENSLSLLHPNWPENIFGKTYFMRPEFLILPLMAFSSLLFIKKEKKDRKTTILFFSLLALLGAFLAKGANDPFGGIFLWIFDNIPGFSFFRDPTKFYLLVAVSYAILIPYALFKISELLKKKNSINLIVLLFIIFWIFTLRLLPASDIVQAKKVPESYARLKDFIVGQERFFRTVWIPTWQRYGYFSDINPAIGRGEIFKDASVSGMIRELTPDSSLQKLQGLSTKYVIIPEDSEGEIFLEDRKYSEEIYSQTVAAINRVPYLTEVKKFGKIRVFEVPGPKDRFSSTNKDLAIEYEFINSTKYKVSVRNAKQGDFLVFSEGYDKHWMAENWEFRIKSSEFEKMLNSFELPKDGNYTLEIYYEPQKWVNIGLIISSLTLAFIILFFVKQYRYGIRKNESEA